MRGTNNPSELHVRKLYSSTIDRATHSAQTKLHFDSDDSEVGQIARRTMHHAASGAQLAEAGGQLKSR